MNYATRNDVIKKYATTDSFSQNPDATTKAENYYLLWEFRL